LRKRSQLVRYRTANLLSIQNLFTRNTGSSMSANQIKGLQVEEIDGIVTANDLALAIKANLSVMRRPKNVEVLEQTVTARVKLRPEFRFLKSVPGIGPILSLTIMLETGDIRRFSTVGNFASYCRCVLRRSPAAPFINWRIPELVPWC
jgi:transposase